MELLHALSIDYNLVCFFDLDTGKGTALRISDCKYKILDELFVGELRMEDNLNKYIDRCVYEEDQEMLRNALSQENLMKKLAEKRVYSVNYRTICYGEMRYFQMKAVCAGDWSKNSGIVLGFHSIDEETRREMEKNTILEDALQQANRASKAKSVFLSNMSHDIRTPLALVIGYADELAHLRTDAMEAEAVTVRAQRIEQQAIRIRTLVTNLNTSNKLAYGMGVWHREKVLLPAVLRASICEVLNRDFDEKYDIDVCIEESLESLYVSGDKELIKRLIENLMNNAISHNPQGCTIKIRLTQKRRCLLHKTVLEVSDNGCGVSRRQLRAFRLARHSDRLPEHGLGVRLVWQIASFHHWQVSFCNNPESGFSCKLYIK